MKYFNKIVSIALLLTLVFPMTMSLAVSDSDLLNSINQIEYSEEFENWLNLSDEEKENSIVPRMYDIPNVMKEFTNPIKVTQLVGNSQIERYSLEDEIPENVVVRNQDKTNLCWAFSSIGSLESTLGLSNYKNGLLTKSYDFSERHMDYATRREFKNGQINPNGSNRNNATGGTYAFANSYLTNGFGPIDEKEMPFDNNSGLIDIDEIKNKKVVAEVTSTVEFPQFRNGDSIEKYRNMMKNHIKEYGAIQCMIHGASPFSEYCNNDTGAIYCDSKVNCPIDHGVIIIGWDDNYPVSNFPEKHRPKNNGAWIIKNSWGEEIEVSLKEMKEILFKDFKTQLESQGYNSPEEVPDSLATTAFKESGFEIRNNTAYKNVGDNGKMYISYEDVNIYSALIAFKKVAEGISYDHIYAYDKQHAALVLPLNVNAAYIGQIFEKETSGTEYLTKIGLTCPEVTDVKVYINKNEGNVDINNMEEVNTKYGPMVTLDPGYNVIEFKEPIEINSDRFAITLELRGHRVNYFNIAVEGKYDSVEMLKYVETESGKCFWTLPGDPVEQNTWIDLSELNTFSGGKLPNCDSTIKAYTVENIKELKIEKLEIGSIPDKITYTEGEDFNSEGLKIYAVFEDGSRKEITDYTIENGESLKPGQDSVIVKYKDHQCEVSIKVKQNNVEPEVKGLFIKQAPNKVVYDEGEDFDSTGMIVELVHSDDSKETVTDYTISDGKNLKSNQIFVTIEYKGFIAKQRIEVKHKENPNKPEHKDPVVTKIEVVTEPDKTKYVEGEDFNSKGMKVEVVYDDGTRKEITDYKVKDGKELNKTQTYVIIEYNGYVYKQPITVSEKEIEKEPVLTKIQITKEPTKLKYVEGEDFDPKGMKVEAVFDNGTRKEITDYKIQYGEKLKLNQTYVTIEYKGVSCKQFISVEAKIKPDDVTPEKPQEDLKPETSKVNNIRAEARDVSIFSKNQEKPYMTMNMTVPGIERPTINDSMNYYYFLSGKRTESNITEWEEIKENQTELDKLSFKIDTRDINYFNEIANEDDLYLYIKEVATKGENRKQLIIKAIPVKIISTGKIEVDTGNDNSNKPENKPSENNNNNNNKDDTISNNRIPNAGKTFAVITLVGAATAAGLFFYIKYKRMDF